MNVLLIAAQVCTLAWGAHSAVGSCCAFCRNSCSATAKPCPFPSLCMYRLVQSLVFNIKLYFTRFACFFRSFWSPYCLGTHNLFHLNHSVAKCTFDPFHQITDKDVAAAYPWHLVPGTWHPSADRASSMPSFSNLPVSRGIFSEPS